MRRIMSCLMTMLLGIYAFTVTSYAEAPNAEISRAEYLKTELIGKWEDFLSVTEVDIMDDGICYTIDPYNNATEFKYLLTDDIAAEDVDYFKQVANVSVVTELPDGTKMDVIELFQHTYSLSGPDIAIYDIEVSEIKGNEFALVMLGFYVDGTHPNNYTQEDYLMVYYVDDHFGYPELRGDSLTQTEEIVSDMHELEEEDEANWDESGYIGNWASYEYSDVLSLEEKGVYHYSALGNISSGIAGIYKVYNDLNDIPAEFNRQIKRSYSANDIQWIVLLDVAGNVFEFGYYDMESDEIWMPDRFIRK